MDIYFWIIIGIIVFAPLGCLAMAIIQAGDAVDTRILELEKQLAEWESKYENK
jgi:hypothetical protein